MVLTCPEKSLCVYSVCHYNQDQEEMTKTAMCWQSPKSKDQDRDNGQDLTENEQKIKILALRKN